MNYIKGRGAQINIPNRFQGQFYFPDKAYDSTATEVENPKTTLFYENPSKIISTNHSPDLPFTYSINPYQGCEHGCIYCYARNTHEFWGFSAGLDFETKIISKQNAPTLLRKEFLKPGWKPEMIMLSGNTDCYQPIERKLKITRNLLQVMSEFGNPVSIITKNVLVLRDLDLLRDLAYEGLVHVIFSISTLDEKLRQKLEPRTATGLKKLLAIEKLVNAQIPVSVMLSPVIPGINNYEIPTIIRESASAGADNIHMTMVRLNGSISELFKDWIMKNFPERAEKVWNQVISLHNGQTGESRWNLRMTGSGRLAESIHHLFRTVKKHYFPHPKEITLNTTRFRRNGMKLLFNS